MSERGGILILGTMTSPSGAPLAALRLAGALRDRGWATRAAFLYAREPIEGGDHPFSTLLDRPPAGPADHVRIASRLASLIRVERPAAVFAFLPLAAVTGLSVARACGVPVRIVSHRVPCDTYGPVMRRLDRLMARAGTYTDVVSVSAAVERSCTGYPDRLRPRMTVIHNGLKDWTPSPLDRAAARSRLGLPADGTLIAAVGRLEPQKNYPLLIEALARTAAPAVLAVAGDGALRGEIEALAAARGIAARVRLLGGLPRAEVPHLLAAADLFAQPSLFEGQSNALLEAFHAGLPALVGDVPEQVETARDEAGQVAGAILPLGDPAAWATAIDRFAGEPSLSAAARAVAAERAGRFSFDRMVGDFEALLRRRSIAAVRGAAVQQTP